MSDCHTQCVTLESPDNAGDLCKASRPVASASQLCCVWESGFGGRPGRGGIILVGYFLVHAVCLLFSCNCLLMKEQDKRWNCKLLLNERLPPQCLLLCWMLSPVCLREHLEDPLQHPTVVHCLSGKVS